MEKLKKIFKISEAPSFWAWSAFALALLVIVASFYYGDTASILRYEIHFIGNLLDGGKLTDYYDYVLRCSDGYGPVTGGNLATYDFPMYIVLGIWGIPLYFMTAAKGIDVGARIPFVVYGKGILVIALVVCLYLVYRIAKAMEMGEVRAKWAAFLCATSAFVYVAIGINGQTDVIGVVFILLGFYFYVNDMTDKGYMKFILGFMLAVPFKMFAVFIFVALLLLRKKKVWEIAVSMVLVVLPKFLLNLAFDQTSLAMTCKKEFEQQIYERLMANHVPFGNGNVSTVVIMLGIVYVWCFLRKPAEDILEYRKNALFATVASLVALFSSFESSSYWFIHMVPFFALMTAYNVGTFKTSMLFEVVAVVCHMFSDYGSRYWAYDIYNCNGMLMEKILGRSYNNVENAYLLQTFCGDTPIMRFNSAFQALFIVLMCAFVWINRPSKITTEGEIKFRPAAVIRMIVNIIVTFIPLILFTYSLLRS